MQQIDVKDTVLIVVGVDLNAEEKDRPIAYYLKSQIDQHARAAGKPYRQGLVITDALWLRDKIIQICPTVAIGGPGVNALAAQLVDKLPVAYGEENRFFIQMEDQVLNNKISIWGMNQATTKMGVDTFLSSGLLDKYLEVVWPSGPSGK